jgi:UDP-N-acetylmuramoyl-tripeptide--D-alanyl-D-alanine ligase
MIAEAARKAGLSTDAVFAVRDNPTAIDLLERKLEFNDTVLIKGSRGMTMEEIVHAFEESTC